MIPPTTEQTCEECGHPLTPAAHTGTLYCVPCDRLETMKTLTKRNQQLNDQLAATTRQATSDMNRLNKLVDHLQDKLSRLTGWAM